MSDVPSASDSNIPEQGSQFMRLLLAHEQRIYGLIFALVPHWADADDLMQETTAVLWRKFDDFEPGTNFAAWAFKIARYQVLDYYKKQRRQRARLSDQTLDQLADRKTEQPGRFDAREEALSHCLRKLGERDRELIQQRYHPDASTADVAASVGRSVTAVYKSLNRIHERLLDCIRCRLAEEGR